MKTYEPRSAHDALPPMIHPEREEISLLAVVTVLLANRGRIILMGITLATLLVVAGLVQGRHYTSAASFVPQSRNPQSMSGLAAQFGLSLAGQKADESSAFYTELLQSHGLLRGVALTEYTAATSRTDGHRPSNLVDAYTKPDKEAALRVDATVKRLTKDIRSAVSVKSGLVTVSVRAESAELSQQIASRVLQLLNRFNLDRRRSQAAEERRFVEGRVGEVKSELRVAEDRLQYFLQANRDYGNSPSLRFQQERLAADVALQRQLFTTLTQSYEQAKIEEVRDTPVITVVELPEVPARPDSRGLLLRALGGLLAGMLLGMAMAALSALTHSNRVQRSEEFAAYTALRNEAISDLKRPWRPLLRAFRGERARLPA